MLVVANGRISVFLNAEIYLTFSLFTYTSTHIELVSIPWLLWITRRWTWEYRLSLHDSDFVSFGYIPRRLLDHMVVLFLSSWGTSILPSIVAALIYIPTYTVPEFHFLHILTSILLSLVFLITNILTSVSSVHSLSRVFYSLGPHGLLHIRLLCPSSAPGTCSNSCPLSRWCHPTISSSVVPFLSCLQSFPASGYFLMSQCFASGGQSIGASASVLPVNIQDWYPWALTGLISLLSKGLSRVFSNTTVQKHQFFGAQLSLWSNSHIHTWLLEKR